MKISVVIATYNQKERLRLVLRGLENQTVQADWFEVLVVDDGCTDGTGEMLRSMEVENVVLVESLEGNQGRCISRNRGIEQAKGDLVVFLDGDALPAPDLLDCYLRAHERSSGNTILCGQQHVLPAIEYFQDPESGSLVDEVALPYSLRRHLTVNRHRMVITEEMVCSGFGAIEAGALEGGYPFEQVRLLQKEYESLCEAHPEPEIGWIGLYPHNVAIPSRLLHKVGGFDDIIPFCEGWELGYRLKMVGGVHSAVMARSYHLYHHHPFADPESAQRERRKRYMAVEYIAARHRDPLVRLIYFWWAHLWPNPLLPEESVVGSLIEFEHLYRTCSAEDLQEYLAILDAVPDFCGLWV